MNKLLIVLVLLLPQTSCCSTKNEAAETPNVNRQLETQKPPEIIEAPALEPPKEPEVIDDGIKEPPSIHNPGDIVEEIQTTETFDHSPFNQLLQKHVSDQGNVNYNGFKTHITDLRNYISSLAAKTPEGSWSKEDKLAYWINAYNALTIDLILRNPSIKSIKEIDDPWDQKLWKLGNKYYDLNEIEHDILRKMNEPRIHFAIVCASVSCPKLQNLAFTASGLESQLTNATKEFLNDSSKNKLSIYKLELSKIFKWFAKDFKQGQTLIDFLNKYSGIEISQKASIRYRDYDWNLNE